MNRDHKGGRVTHLRVVDDRDDPRWETCKENHEVRDGAVELVQSRVEEVFVGASESGECARVVGELLGARHTKFDDAQNAFHGERWAGRRGGDVECVGKDGFVTGSAQRDGLSNGAWRGDGCMDRLDRLAAGAR